ncbi:MAG TPA: YciI family protein [Opitutaceae bacterium]|nr:YciI family protein [Opitutaceae bacterium]
MPNQEKAQFLLLFRHPVDQPDPSPEEMQQIFGKWMAWMESMKAQGQFVAAAPLQDGGKVLRGSRGSVVTDGPFTEAKEMVGGYVIVHARDLAEAAEIAKGCPGYDYGTVTEVRPLEKIPHI